MTLFLIAIEDRAAQSFLVSVMGKTTVAISALVTTDAGGTKAWVFMSLLILAAVPTIFWNIDGHESPRNC